MQEFEKGHLDWVGSLALSKSGLFLFSSGGDKKIIQWKAIEGKKFFEFDQVHKEGVYSIVLSQDEEFLFSGSGDK